MRPRYKYVPFVEANKERLYAPSLLQHFQCPLPAASRLSAEDWWYVSRNTSAEAIALLTAHPEDIAWRCLSRNPAAMSLIRAYPDFVSWKELSANTSSEALDMLEANVWKIHWDLLSLNSNPRAVALLRANPDEIDWVFLCANSGAIVGDAENLHYATLSGNSSSYAMGLLEANPEEIDWRMMSSNASGMALLEANPDKVQWNKMSLNPSIYELDYAAMRRHMQPIRDELLRNRMHPDRLDQARHSWQLM
jgi:hypothetical protein